MLHYLATLLTLAAAPAQPAQLAAVGSSQQAAPTQDGFQGGLAGTAGLLHERSAGRDSGGSNRPGVTPERTRDRAGVTGSGARTTGSSSPGSGSSGSGNSGASGKAKLGSPGGWSATPGSATNRPTPPPDPNLPDEALPGAGQALLFYQVHIGGFGMGTQTGYWEDFFVYSPDQTKERPLLVVFHKYGVSHYDAWLNTEFFQEAVRRGWHIIAPLSASGVHMGSIEGQINTEKAIEWMMGNFNIDKDRIYGVGFSMGGGAVTNFAARHLDHAKYSFAAVVDHTGGIAHEDTYVQSPSTQFVFDFWFGNGNPGSTDPFKMARSCLLDFHPDTLVVDPTNDLARNLTSVPIKVTRAAVEPLSTAYLSKQCDVFVNHLLSLGGKVVYEIVPYFGHSWDMLDERATVDWLGVHRLKVPTAHSTLADGDYRYYHFDVTQDAPQAFTPFTWSVDTTLNRLDLSATANLADLGVDLASAGLSATQTFELNLSTSDNLADEVTLQGWPTAPTAVHRDGVQEFTNWNYDSIEQELVIQEFDGTAAHQWVITP